MTHIKNAMYFLMILSVAAKASRTPSYHLPSVAPQFSFFHEGPSPKDSDTINILSIDGGGIRGIIALYVLQAIEKETGKPISQLFDLTSGTSTGGIIALGLNVPKDVVNAPQEPKYSAQDLLEIYTKRAGEIFGKTQRHYFSGDGLLRPRYSHKGLEKLARDIFGDLELSDAISPVLVPSFEPTRNLPYIFQSNQAKACQGENFYMRDIAEGTSSAPTFFKPKKMLNKDGIEYTMVDGGLVNNNPAMTALATARSMYPHAKNFRVVSLGTGTVITSQSYGSMKKKGGLQLVNSLVNIMLDGVSSTVDMQMRSVLPPEEMEKGVFRKRYFRFQTTIPRENKAMDDISSKNIAQLGIAGERCVKANAVDLQSLCSSLVDEQLLRSMPKTPKEKESKESFEYISMPTVVGDAVKRKVMKKNIRRIKRNHSDCYDFQDLENTHNLAAQSNSKQELVPSILSQSKSAFGPELTSSLDVQ